MVHERIWKKNGGNVTRIAHEKLKEELDTLGYPVKYRVFSEGEVPKAPFIIYYEDETDNFSADGIVYDIVNGYKIEFYFDKKMPDAEKQLETLLTNLGLFWDKEEVWIESEKYIEVIYSI